MKICSTIFPLLKTHFVQKCSCECEEQAHSLRSIHHKPFNPQTHTGRHTVTNLKALMELKCVPTHFSLEAIDF